MGTSTITRTIQGVAPRANIVSYLVCFPSCPVSSSVAAVDQAIADGVDVLNFSVSGTRNPWTVLVDLAFLEAYQAGIFVSAAAGNEGPGSEPLGHPGPWNAALASSAHGRVCGQSVDLPAPGPVPPALTGLPAPPGGGPGITSDIEAEIRFAGQVSPGNSPGCSPFPAGSF